MPPKTVGPAAQERLDKQFRRCLERGRGCRFCGESCFTQFNAADIFSQREQFRQLPPAAQDIHIRHMLHATDLPVGDDDVIGSQSTRQPTSKRATMMSQVGRNIASKLWSFGRALVLGWGSHVFPLCIMSCAVCFSSEQVQLLTHLPATPRIQTWFLTVRHLSPSKSTTHQNQSLSQKVLQQRQEQKNGGRHIPTAYLGSQSAGTLSCI